jgi:hypothetical protein
MHSFYVATSTNNEICFLKPLLSSIRTVKDKFLLLMPPTSEFLPDFPLTIQTPRSRTLHLPQYPLEYLSNDPKIIFFCCERIVFVLYRFQL